LPRTPLKNFLKKVLKNFKNFYTKNNFNKIRIQNRRGDVFDGKFSSKTLRSDGFFLRKPKTAQRKKQHNHKNCVAFFLVLFLSRKKKYHSVPI